MRYHRESNLRAGSEAATANGAWLAQRKCGCGGSAGKSGQCGECEEEERLQRQVADPSINSIPSVVTETLTSPGQPLDTQTRAFMESRFSHSFSSLQVHSVTPRKPQASHSDRPAIALSKRQTKTPSA
jgi:hypothetical protein